MFARRKLFMLWMCLAMQGAWVAAQEFAAPSSSTMRFVQSSGISANEPLGFSAALVDSQAPSSGATVQQGMFEDQPYIVGDMHDPEGPAPATSSNEWIRNGCWYMEQAAVFMSRSANVKNVVILGVDFTSSIDPHLRTFLDIPLNTGFQPGLRSTLGRYLGRDAANRDHSVEFTFLGLTHWHVAGQLPAAQPGGILSPLDPIGATPAFNRSDFQNFDMSTTFNSYELNYRIDRRLTRDELVYTRDSKWVRRAKRGPLPSLIGGLRVVILDERLGWFAQSSTLPASTGAYRVNTHNNMVGPQVGADWFWERSDWRLGVRGKGAAMVNWSDQNTQVRILDTTGTPLVPNRDEQGATHPLAFVGELNFIGQYRFRPNFSFRASYDLLWATNLALAQNQVTFTPTTVPHISTGHALFFQGVTFGFELSR